MNAVGALLYLTQCARLDIAFSVNLLVRLSFPPTPRHWNNIKHVFHYLRGAIDLGLFYSNKPTQKSNLVGYAYTRCLSNPHKIIRRQDMFLRIKQVGIVYGCDLSSIIFITHVI